MIMGVSQITLHLPDSQSLKGKHHAEEILSHVRRYIEETRPDCIVSNVETELITW
jgi:hypothetical protein